MALKPWSGTITAGVAAVVNLRHPYTLVFASDLAFINRGAADVEISWDGGGTFTTTVKAGECLSVMNTTVDVITIRGVGGAAATVQWVATDKDEA
jgi:hypothetical protein